VWTPVKLVFMGKTIARKCVHYNGTQVNSNSIVPRIRKKGNVQGTACGFFKARQLSIQSVIPTDTDDSKYNPMINGSYSSATGNPMLHDVQKIILIIIMISMTERRCC